VATTTGDKYLVTPQSVARHIAQLDELRALASVASHRDMSRPVATGGGASGNAQVDSESATAATADTDVSRYVVRLEREVEQARDERDFLREQIDRKDKTIDALIERDRETNFLVRGLQEMLTPLLGSARREPPIHENQQP
jgi:hypothetical protein